MGQGRGRRSCAAAASGHPGGEVSALPARPALTRAAPSSQGSSHLPQQLKFTTSDSCDRIKDEFQLLQAQYHR